MASGVNVKMGVSGVAQFKQNISQAKNAVKTLDAQLSLTEKQFKATGDSESYVAEKTELLKAKMEAQKRVIANTEEALQKMTEQGVDRASKAYQDMYQQMINAKGALIDTETALGNIGTAAGEANDGVSDMNESLKGIDKKLSYDMVLDGLSTITSGIEKVIRKAWELGAALVRNTLGAGAWADELQETAAKYEITPEQLQRMRKTASIIDTDAETILAAKNKMKQVIGAGGNNTTDALEALGLGTIVETDPEEQFWKIGEAIMNLGDAYERENAAQKLFGRSWRELIPLFQAGREEYDKVNKSWSVLEDDQLDGLAKMDDQYQTMQREWETFKMELLDAFSGPLTEGMETITGLFQELNKYLDSPQGQAMLAQIGETVSGLIGDLTNINPEDVINTLRDIIDGIVDGLKWIDENKDAVKTAIEVIAGAFVTMKVAMLGINIAKVVNGAKSLLHGKGGNDGSSTVNTTGTNEQKTATEEKTGKTGKVLDNAVTGMGTAFSIDYSASQFDLRRQRENYIKQLVSDYGLDWNNPTVFKAAHEEIYAKGAYTSENVLELTEGFEEQLEKLNEDIDQINHDMNQVSESKYMTVYGSPEGQAKMKAFAEHFFSWWNDEITDAGLDKLAGGMSGEDFFSFKDAMEKIMNGELLYSDAEQAEFVNAMDKAIEAAEDLIEEDVTRGKNAITSEDMKEFKKTPGKIEDAVKNGISGIRIYLDGEEISAVVSRHQGSGVYALVQ